MSMHSYGEPDGVLVCDDANAIGESEKALLVEMDGEEEWIPKDHIHDDSECYKKGTTGTLVVSQWLAQQRGWGP